MLAINKFQGFAGASVMGAVVTVVKGTRITFAVAAALIVAAIAIVNGSCALSRRSGFYKE